MCEDRTSFRRERIERLLNELRYEVERGIMENEIDEEIGFRFIVPISRKIPDGAVQCEFRTQPVPARQAFTDGPPRLRIVSGERDQEKSDG